MFWLKLCHSHWTLITQVEHPSCTMLHHHPAATGLLHIQQAHMAIAKCFAPSGQFLRCLELVLQFVAEHETGKVPGSWVMIIIDNPYTLWLFNIAMGNGPFIDGLPIKNGGSFHGYVSHNQRVIDPQKNVERNERKTPVEATGRCTERPLISSGPQTSPLPCAWLPLRTSWPLNASAAGLPVVFSIRLEMSKWSPQ